MLVANVLDAFAHHANHVSVLQNKLVKFIASFMSLLHGCPFVHDVHRVVHEFTSSSFMKFIVGFTSSVVVHMALHESRSRQRQRRRQRQRNGKDKEKAQSRQSQHKDKDNKEKTTARPNQDNDKDKAKTKGSRHRQGADDAKTTTTAKTKKK